MTEDRGSRQPIRTHFSEPIWRPCVRVLLRLELLCVAHVHDVRRREAPTDEPGKKTYTAQEYGQEQYLLARTHEPDVVLDSQAAQDT